MSHKPIPIDGPAEYDALIVGAGPAGLFAALSLFAAGVERIALIDAGPDADERRRASALSREVGWGHPDYERGIGGAGLFSDGKLCLSLDVGGHLEHSLDEDTRADLLRQIEGVFKALVSGPFLSRELDRERLGAWRDLVAADGLNFKYYPVAHIGTDRCGAVIARLRDVLEEAGASVYPRTELVDLRLGSEGTNTADLRTEGEAWSIETPRVVLALGKVGARRQAQFCRRLGSEVRPQPIYVGVRFETKAAALVPLFEITKDPKYSLALKDGSRVKTHCASEGGEVIPLRYEGMPLAGGHNYFDAVTSRSGFSILWDGLDHGGDSHGAAKRIMRQAADLGGDKLLAQRLVDLRAGVASQADDLAKLDLSCPEVVAGDVRAILPEAFFPAMERLLDRLESLVPGIANETSVLYSPAIEWWMERVDVDDHFRLRTAPGVVTCGDGSGWSQGIVHAAATGLLAATGLHEREVDVAHWLKTSKRQAIRT